MAGLFDLTGFLTPVVQKLASYIPDPEARAKAEAEATTQMLNFVASQNTAQLKVDAAEADSKSLFIAGWRPFVGWCGGIAFMWSTFGCSVANWLLQIVHPGAAAIAQIPVGDMSQVLLAMLGLGGMRTYEKVRSAGSGLQ